MNHLRIGRSTTNRPYQNTHAHTTGNETEIKAAQRLIGLRLLDQDLPHIPSIAIRRMPYSAQCAAVAVNATGNPSEILSAMTALGIRNAEKALTRCVTSVPAYIPDMTMRTVGYFPPDPLTLFVAALEVLK